MPEIFQLDFMVRAFIAGGFVGAISPLLGTFLVLRRLSLIADTLAHVALLGVAIGLLLDRYPVFFAVVAAAVGSLIIERLRSSNRFSSDAALALVLYTALATAVVIISLGDGFNVDLFSFLFGGIVTVAYGPSGPWAGLWSSSWFSYTESWCSPPSTRTWPAPAALE